MLYLATGLRDAGHECVLACQRGGPAAMRAKEASLTVVELKMRGEVDFVAAAKLAALAGRSRCDLIHAHTSHAHSLAVLAKVLLRGRCAVVVHRRVDFSIHKLPFRLSLLKYRLGVDRYIAVAEAVKCVMVGDGVPGDRIDVVRSCTDLARFDAAEPAGLRRELGLPRDAAIVGNVGFLVGHKDHANLLRAAAIVCPRHPEAHFVIVGEGDMRPGIEALREELGLAGRVVLTGFRSDIPSVLADFDVFALSSCMEGIAGVLFEAMASRVPVVTTDAGGIAEYLVDRVNGRLVPTRDPEALAEAILYMLEEPQDRARLAEAGRQTVEERFSTDALTEQTLEVYDRALADRRQPSRST